MAAIGNEAKSLQDAIKILDLDQKKISAEIRSKIKQSDTIARLGGDEFGIIIRDFSSQPLLKDCARISIGAPNENDALLTALKKIL